MALINCAECGREFSDKAAACPQCAAPIDVAHSDSHGASTPGFTRSGLIERRSHNEILIRAPGPTAFDYVRDALVLTANSLRVSTVPLSISADFEIDQPLATAKICVLFEIPDPATTLLKIEEQSGPDLSFAASQKAIEWVAKTIIDHVAISVPREPDVTSKRGVVTGSGDYDDRQSAIEKKPPVSFLPVLIFISAVTIAALIGYYALDPKHTGKAQKPSVERVTATAQSNPALSNQVVQRPTQSPVNAGLPSYAGRTKGEQAFYCLLIVTRVQGFYLQSPGYLAGSPGYRLAEDSVTVAIDFQGKILETLKNNPALASSMRNMPTAFKESAPSRILAYDLEQVLADLIQCWQGQSAFLQ